jgi:hypothetical protein
MSKFSKYLIIYQKLMVSQAWWCMPIIPALGRLRQEDHDEFEASQGYTMRSYHKIKQKLIIRDLEPPYKL